MLAHLLLVLAAAPHDGPPYPVIVDEPVGPYLISVWADPDVGVGTFHVMLDPPDGGELPGGTSVDVHVRPVDGHLRESSFACVPTRRADGLQFEGRVDFPTRERWRARFVLDGDGGGGEIATEVEVTPPGLGRLDLLWFAAPFLAIAFLWINAMLRARARSAT